MKLLQKIGLLLICCTILIACATESTKNPPIVEKVPTKEPIKTPEKMNKSLTTLNEFWAVFQKAVAEKDMETLKAISDMDELGSTFYTDYFFEFCQATIAAGKVAQIKPSEAFRAGCLEFLIGEDVGSVDDLGVHSEEAGSAIALYFDKTASGNYQVVGSLSFG